jgi:tetratricopeptide (TPR) repeat protein
MRLGARALAWVLVLGLALPAWAINPLTEVDHPLVAKGRQAYEAHKYEDALAAFEEAKKQRPDDPAVEYNRAVTLAQLGRAAEAKSAFLRVTESNRPDLQEKAWYNLGNVHANTGERKEALQSYRKALRLDPHDELARHNYEVVLRNLPPPQEGGSDGGVDGGDAGSDGGSDGGRPDAGQDGGQQKDGGRPVDGGTDGGDGGSDAGQQGDGGMDGGRDGGGDGGSDGGGDAGADGGDGGDGGGQQGGGQGDGGSDGGSGEGKGEGEDGGADAGRPSDEQTESRADAGVSPEDIDKQDAERLLDAMKQNEKNLQLWRFQQKKKPRKPNEKDW